MSKISKKIQLRIDLGCIMGVFILASVGSTQFIAHQFDYASALGTPLVGHWYTPLNWIVWQLQFGSQGPQTFSFVNVCLLFILSITLYVYYTVLRIRSRSSTKHEGIHGTARFATEEEIRKTGLLPAVGPATRGVYVGASRDKKGILNYLRHDGPEHVIAIAPTRSGKGVGLVIPTLLTWPESTVVHDMKGELWHLTAGYREKMGGKVLKFDPAAEKGSCTFNPLEEVRYQSIHSVGDVQNLVTILVDPDGKGLADHWAKTAHAFLTGVILHLLLKNSGQACLSDVAFALSDPDRAIEDLYDEMVKNRHTKKNEQASLVVAAAGRDMLNRPEQERGSVLSSAMSYLSIYRDPLVAKNTKKSDFRIHDLMHQEEPLSLYLVVRPADKDRLKPLMRLILNQIVRVLSRDEIYSKKYQNRLLLMLDEFPSFGKLEVFQEALAFIAGYGMKAYLITQDIAQLWAAYGQNETILSNCHVRIAYAPNNPHTAEWLSKMLGQTTVVVEEVSTSGKRIGGMLKHFSHSYRSIPRPLMTPEEVSQLKGIRTDKNGKTSPGEMLIFVAGHPPIKGTQILYFQDTEFQRRASIKPPEAPVEPIQIQSIDLQIDITEEVSAEQALDEAKPERKALTQVVGHEPHHNNEEQKEALLSQ